MRSLLEGGGYFNVGTQRCGAYLRSALNIGNTVIKTIYPSLKNLEKQVPVLRDVAQKSFTSPKNAVSKSSYGVTI